MGRERVVATKSDWKIYDMPEEHEVFQFKRKISKEELQNLRYGNIPQEMEDKWFWYMEGNTLYAHRSWTGSCIFVIEINEDTGIHNVTVNRRKEVYTVTSIEEDIDIINELLDWWCKPQYNYYEEFLEETRENLEKSETNKEPSINIFLSIGDITKLECDCIVNVANKSLLGGGGVDGAIHRAAGPELLEECRMLHGCDTGEAKITKGYKLLAKYIIHTVGPIYSGKEEDARLLAMCYKNSLNLAKENNIHSIAFPAISTGVYGYPLKEATDVAIKQVLEWIVDNQEYDMDIIFCSFDQKTNDVYDNILSTILQ